MGIDIDTSRPDDAIVIRKLEATCVFCGSADGVAAFKGRGVCGDCRRSLTAD